MILEENLSEKLAFSSASDKIIGVFMFLLIISVILPQIFFSKHVDMLLGLY